MAITVPVVEEFGARLAALGWVSDLLVAGSLATGDYVPGVSDLDLGALTAGPVGPQRQAELTALHRRIDEGAGRGMDLGCVYVDSARRADPGLEHPTWTHGLLVQRILSGVTRAELVRHGYAVFGRAPAQLLPAVSDDDVRSAARAELTGYWAWAARRPWIWWSPALADLGLTSMARGRHALAGSRDRPDGRGRPGRLCRSLPEPALRGAATDGVTSSPLRRSAAPAPGTVGPLGR